MNHQVHFIAGKQENVHPILRFDPATGKLTVLANRNTTSDNIVAIKMAAAGFTCNPEDE